jgi:hypothetical protein
MWRLKGVLAIVRNNDGCRRFFFYLGEIFSITWPIPFGCCGASKSSLDCLMMGCYY